MTLKELTRLMQFAGCALMFTVTTANSAEVNPTDSVTRANTPAAKPSNPPAVQPAAQPKARAATVLPTAGMSMQRVRSQFGQPIEQLPSTGQPPITVWRYRDFNVYFEHRHVVHSVRFVPFVRPVTVITE